MTTINLYIHNVTLPNNVSQEYLSHLQMLTLSYIGVSTSVLSIFGAGSVVFAAAYNSKLCNANVHPIFHLSLGDFFAALCMFVSCMLFIFKTDNIIVVCAYTAALTNSFFITTFFLTILYAQQVFARLKLSRDRRYSIPSNTSRYLFVSFYALSWIVPLVCNLGLILSVHLANDEKENVTPCYSCFPLFHYREDNCKPIHEVSPSWSLTRRIFFFVPLLGVMIGNTAVYLLIIREYRRHTADKGVLSGVQHQITKQISTRAVFYQSVFFFCWIPSLILGIIVLTEAQTMTESYYLYIIQSITAPLQGFLNSVVYAWLRKSFTGTLKSDNNAFTGSSFTTDQGSHSRNASLAKERTYLLKIPSKRERPLIYSESSPSNSFENTSDKRSYSTFTENEPTKYHWK